MNWVTKAKASAFAAACHVTKVYLNTWTLKGVGEMLKIVVCSEKKTVEASILLNGEKEALDITVGKYEFQANGRAGSVLLKNVQTSRAWLNTLLESLYPEGLSINLNDKTYAILNKTL